MLYCSITDKENIHIPQTEGLKIPGGGGGMHLKEMYEMYEVQLVFHRVLIKKNPFHGGGMDIYQAAKARDKISNASHRHCSE